MSKQTIVIPTTRAIRRFNEEVEHFDHITQGRFDRMEVPEMLKWHKRYGEKSLQAKWLEAAWQAIQAEQQAMDAYPIVVREKPLKYTEYVCSDGSIFHSRLSAEGWQRELNQI